MKNILAITVSIVALSLAYAQQLPQSSQYMFNQFMLNPAVAGATDHHEVKAGYRSQWVGIEGAPQTTYLTAHTHLGRHIGLNAGRHRNENSFHQGLGFMAVRDVTGPTSRTSVYGAYAVNKYLSKTVKISFGASLGLKQYAVDGDKLRVRDNSTALTATTSQIVPDASIGTWLYAPHWYAGLSIQQMFQSRVRTEIEGTKAGKLTNHYFLTGGLKIDLNGSGDYFLVPSVLVKYNYPSTPTVDIGTKFRLREIFWVGAALRNMNAAYFMTGCLIGEMVEVGYSYDLTINKLAAYGRSSHEIMLGLRIGARQEVRSPSDFW